MGKIMQRTAYEYHTVSDIDMHFSLKYSEKKKEKSLFMKKRT